MKELNNYIIEKLKINKNASDGFTDFCKSLYLNYEDKEAEKLYKLYEHDCYNIINKSFKGLTIATDFEMLFMICVMLLDDKMPPEEIELLGYNSYAGDNNPFNYSWFEEESDDGEVTVLEFIQQLYVENTTVDRVFRGMYDSLKKCCTDYHKAIDAIWNLYG